MSYRKAYEDEPSGREALRFLSDRFAIGKGDRETVHQIVREHNAFDDLLAACQSSLEIFLLDFEPCEPGCDCIIHTLEAAIAKATEPREE